MASLSPTPDDEPINRIFQKRFKISIFQPNHFGTAQKVPELLIHKDDFPGLFPGDVLEIYHPENEEDQEVPRLLLMISKSGIYPDNELAKPLARDSVYVEKSVAETYKLPNFKDVIVTQIDTKHITLDSIELTFKEQYMGRSDMWRLAKSLKNTGVYLHKKVDLGQLRCQVNEMWSQGYRVSSGVISSDTKIVFRSPTAMVYLFIQMSSEMWQFDVHGELYFEKAVDGFLSEMFRRWQRSGSSHEVTIVLFSRCFYRAKSADEFPQRMQECLRPGPNGCFYEDFYRVVIQNERFDDWFPTLQQLKEIFANYKKSIIDYHKTIDESESIPEAFISSAAQGNFLEVLNISLNTFEHHYLNRNLDRTGQQSIVITPGVGIFEVDRELTMITKQRIIDSGVGSDLICVGEQPLHAVPLFKYNSKHRDSVHNSDLDTYSMPHWINLSFYSKGKTVGYSNFKSRISIPRSVDSRISKPKPQCCQADTAMLRNNVKNPISVDPYDAGDAYDDSVFFEDKSTKRKMSDPELSLTKADIDEYSRGAGMLLQGAEPLSPGSDTTGAMFSSSSWDDTSNGYNFDKVMKNLDKTFIGSIDNTFDHQAIKKYLLRPGRALVNPFDPSQTTIRLSSNRRRWTHIFPKGPTGQHQQLHHEDLSDVFNQISSSLIRDKNPHNQKQQQPPPQQQQLVWNTSENIWSANQQSGVDWKSLTIPASLPITTDYFPDPVSLVKDYFVNEYEIVPEVIFSEIESTGDRSPLQQKNDLPSTEEVFTELISQRLAQGFQVILLTPQQEEAIMTTTTSSTLPTSPVTPTSVASSRSFASRLRLTNRNSATPNKRLSVVVPQNVLSPAAEYWLSIGRIFHRVTLSSDKNTIKVSRYSPRHPYEIKKSHYRYRFEAPDNDNYEVSWVDFKTEKLENFNWNHMDFYVCTRGDNDTFLLTENLKYWRYRLMAIPITPYLKFTKKIMENLRDAHCDIYDEPIDSDAKIDMVKKFLRFVEVYLNKIRRPNINTTPNPSKPPQRTPSGLREHRATTVSAVDRGNIIQYKLRHQSGGQGSFVSSFGLGHLSPESKGSNSSMDQNQIGSYEAPSLGMSHPDDDVQDKERLKLTSTLFEICEAMTIPKTGLSFVNKALPEMPLMTFVAFEAVLWIMENVDGVTSEVMAMKILKNMQEKKYICHASGHQGQPFINGFYLFSLNPNPTSNPTISSIYKANLALFRNDWVEIEFSPRVVQQQQQEAEENILTETEKETKDSNTGRIPEFLHSTLSDFTTRKKLRETLASKSFYKSVYLDIDHSGKSSDRKEWGHMKYQCCYDPTEAFEIVIQWSVATGAIISELLHTWARRAQSLGITLIPVPSDPFALPITLNSDPVRGPIFIELDTDCLLEENQSDLFEAFPDKSTWEQRLFLFREAIAQRFGFVNNIIDQEQQPSSAKFSTYHQYVHCTGNMFLLIPTQLQELKVLEGIQGIKGHRQSVVTFETGSLKRRSTIKHHPEKEVTSTDLHLRPTQTAEDSFGCTRHLSDTKPAYDHSQTGFLWSWNFMISRKWKHTSNTGATGDIAFMDKILEDFRSFCRNDQDRLREFWRNCWDAHNKSNGVQEAHDSILKAVDLAQLSDY